MLQGRIGIGVLGTGYWGSKISQEYATIADTSEQALLAYVADMSQDALQSIRRKLNHDHTRFTDDYSEVLAQDGVDAVHIALPNELHFEVARAALDAGKHVLIEKPMATTARAAFKLARLADEKGLVLQVGHIFRFNNSLRAVKRILRSGCLGRICYASLVWATDMEPPRNRDIVFDLAPHPIDVLNFLLEEWPIEAHALGHSYVRRSPNQEEMAFMNLEYPDEILVHVYVSWIQHGAKERSIKLVCDGGTLTCDALNQTIAISPKRQSTISLPDGISTNFDAFRNSSNNSDLVVGVTPNNTIRDMELHFLDRIRGRGPQYNSGLIGAETVQVLESITSAMRSRQASQEKKLFYNPLIAP